MRMRLRSQQVIWIFGLARVLFAIALLISFLAPSWAMAQSTGDPWDEPINLSRSGIAKNPSFVIDSEGAGHAIWFDDVANFVYSGFDGNQWSAPDTTNLNRLFRLTIPGESLGPRLTIYTGPNPRLVAGPGDFTFAFWISPRGKLFASKVRNADFEHVAAWDSEHFVTPQAGSFAAAVDARGELHLAYVRTISDPQSPAGIYYTRSKDSGWTWSLPVLLYDSSYLRRLGEGQASISLAIAGADDTQRIYVAWDNRPRKQVFLAQSVDNGITWEEPKLIAGPEPDSGSDGPFNIHVGAGQDSVVLVWQNGLPGGACSQVYQSSLDAGATWSDPQLMIKGLLGCALSNEFVTGIANDPKSPLYFLTETQSQVYLSAWNGRQWSEPQAQPTLSGFEEPEIYTGVDYGCHRASLLGQRLYIVGCDLGGGGDVWATSLDLSSQTSWFSPPVWSQPARVADDSLKMESVELASTDDGLIHAFFNLHNDPAVYYTYWDGDLWSRITAVLKLPEGEAAWPSITTGPKNQLFLIARSNSGKLYLSRATSGNAASESRWSTPARLAVGHDGEIGSIAVAWDAAATVYIAYSVPVNEQRGIYLVQSKDEGTTWSEPEKVFDGSLAGFDLVGAPSLRLSADGVLHVIWKEQSIEGDGVSQPVSLFYTRSKDGGHTFTDAQALVEEPVAWRDIMTDGKGNLHLLWQPQDTLTTVWDQVSSDGGQTWQYPEGMPDDGKLATVTTDPAGRLHLLGVGSGSLDHWLWDGNRWQSETPLGLPWSLHKDNRVDLLAATVNKQGKMMVVFAQPATEGDPGAMSLLYSTRTVEFPQKQSATQVAVTPMSAPPTRTPLALTPEPSATPVGAGSSQGATPESPTAESQSDDPVSPLVMALVPVALLLLGVLGIGIRQTARLKDL